MNIALFDLDNTLLAGDSDVEWPRYLIGEGVLDADYYNRENDQLLRRLQGRHAGYSGVSGFPAGPAGRATAPSWTPGMRNTWRATSARSSLRGRELIQQHQANGDLVVIITATNRFITGPIAAELGVEHLIATEAGKSAPMAD